MPSSRTTSSAWPRPPRAASPPLASAAASAAALAARLPSLAAAAAACLAVAASRWRRVVRPALASQERAEVSIADWDAFVADLIELDASAASRRKTRSTVIGALVSLGVAERAATAGAPVALSPGRPDPLAFGWALGEQLAGELREACDAGWAATDSDAALLFGVTQDYGEACIRATVAKGLLVRDGDTLRLPG